MQTLKHKVGRSFFEIIFIYFISNVLKQLNSIERNDSDRNDFVSIFDLFISIDHSDPEKNENCLKPSITLLFDQFWIFQFDDPLKLGQKIEFLNRVSHIVLSSLSHLVHPVVIFGLFSPSRSYSYLGLINFLVIKLNEVIHVKCCLG